MGPHKGWFPSGSLRLKFPFAIGLRTSDAESKDATKPRFYSLKSGLATKQNESFAPLFPKSIKQQESPTGEGVVAKPKGNLPDFGAFSFSVTHGPLIISIWLVPTLSTPNPYERNSTSTKVQHPSCAGLLRPGGRDHSNHKTHQNVTRGNSGSESFATRASLCQCPNKYQASNKRKPPLVFAPYFETHRDGRFANGPLHTNCICLRQILSKVRTVDGIST